MSPGQNPRQGVAWSKECAEWGPHPSSAFPSSPRLATVSTSHFPSSSWGPHPLLYHTHTHARAQMAVTGALQEPKPKQSLPHLNPPWLHSTLRRLIPALWLPFEAWISGPCFPDLFSPISGILHPKFFLPGMTFPLTYPRHPQSRLSGPKLYSMSDSPRMLTQNVSSPVPLPGVGLGPYGPQNGKFQKHLSCACHTMGNIVT